MSDVALNKSLEYLKNLKLGDASYNSKVQKLYMQIYECKKLISVIEKFADDYTFDQHQRECGFRSIIKVFLSAVNEALVACSQPKWIWRIFYSKNRQIKNLQIHCDILDNFMKMFRNLHIIHEKSTKAGCLISEEAVYDNMIMKTLHEVNLQSFYGTQIGFYHSSPTKLQSRFFIVAMTTFSDFFYSAQHLAIRLLKVPISMIKYTIYPTLCAQRADDMIRNVDIDVMKIGMLFFMSKISCFVQNIFNHRLAVNKILKISPEPIQIRNSSSDRLIDIPVPSSHFKSRPIPCRLLSATKRCGMVGENSKQEMSKYLIIHAHGGGFFAHTSASHEIYLRSWAHHLDVPILAIEYSLTPEAPFPRAIEEIFYVYCWVLKTGGKLLGTTAENVIFVGDSAGANLTMAVFIKCIENGVPPPKGILSVYGLFLSNYATVPSRMLGFFDVFLTYSMTVRIFKTYAGFFKKRDIIKNGKIPIAPEDEFDDKIPKNHLMSPIWASEDILRQLPKVRLLTTEFDPLLDENIEMAKKLRELNVDVKLDVLHDLLHGFLHLIKLDSKSYEGSMKCVHHLRDLLELGKV